MSNYGQAKVEQIYQELVERSDLDSSDKQMIYNGYAKYLNMLAMGPYSIK